MLYCQDMSTVSVIHANLWEVQGEFLKIGLAQTLKSKDELILIDINGKVVLKGRNLVYSSASRLVLFTGDFVYSEGDFTGTVKGHTSEHVTHNPTKRKVDFGSGPVETKYSTTNLRYIFETDGVETHVPLKPGTLISVNASGYKELVVDGEVYATFVDQVFSKATADGGCGCGS
jgi:hypothetical protein